MPQRGQSQARLTETGSLAESGIASDRQRESLEDVQRARYPSEFVAPAGPGAANDDCYAEPDGFPEFRASIAALLVRALLWWAVGVCLIVAAFAAVLR